MNYEEIRPRKVLVVEDSALAAHSLRLALRMQNYMTHVACDGEQALSMFETNGYDIVITDFKIPKIDGLSLAGEIKKRAPACPVILLTAYAEAAAKKMGETSLVDTVLTKPVGLEKLHSAVGDLLQAGKPAASATS